MSRTIDNANGFTLIEVLVATCVMLIVLSGITAMGVSTIRSDSQSNTMSAATLLARAKLEELRLLPRTDADWAAGSHSETGLHADGSIGDGAYVREWVVEEDYNTNKNLSRVIVTVSWYDGEVSLTSLYW